MASIYPYREGFQAAVMVNGERVRRVFATYAAARRWAAETEAGLRQAAAPQLGGPTRATLAEALAHYAHLYTVGKKGARAEL